MDVDLTEPGEYSSYDTHLTLRLADHSVHSLGVSLDYNIIHYKSKERSFPKDQGFYQIAYQGVFSNWMGIFQLNYRF